MIYTLSKGISLFLYLLVFIIGGRLYCLKDKVYINEKKSKWFVIFLILIVPTLFAGFRYQVGTDYFTYAYDIYRWNNQSLFDYIKTADLIGGTPIGSFILAKLSHNYFTLFFLYSVLAYLPIVYILICEYEENDNELISFFGLIYLLTNYPTSLNIMKQSIACSFVLLGFYFLHKRKLGLYFLTIFVAFLFHQTSLIVLPIFFVFDKDGKVSERARNIIFIGFLFVIVFINSILLLIGSDWAEYINSEGTSNLSFYLNLVWVVVFLLNYNSLIEFDRRNELLVFLFVLGTMLSVLGFWSVYGKRISLYFTVCQFILMSELPFCSKNINNRFPMKIAISAYCIALFVFSYFIKGQSDIIPYSFYIYW